MKIVVGQHRIGVGDYIVWQAGKRQRSGVVVGFRTTKGKSGGPRIMVDTHSNKRGGGLAHVRPYTVIEAAEQ